MEGFEAITRLLCLVASLVAIVRGLFQDGHGKTHTLLWAVLLYTMAQQ